MKRISTQAVQSAQNVLVLGFDNHSYILLNEQDGIDYYSFATFENSFKAFAKLEDKVYRTPAAIICSYDFLKKEKFRFLKSISNNAEYRKIPFIVISSDGMDISVEEALSMGIDDCYTEPVDWKSLKVRVAFLQQHKPAMIANEKELLKSGYHFKTPLGKRIFDCIIAIAVMVILSPILLLIVLCIKMEGPGPIIYRSKRIGQGYKVFDFFKFRSMCVNADEKREEVSHMSIHEGAFLKVKNDPRVTKIGWLIRKTSLDELPQLLNVLRGEMSIVGNRPLPLSEAELVTTDEWAARFLAPAGITGLWQTAPGGKEKLSQEERIALDIEYAQNLTIGMDLRILMRTLPAMLQKGE